MLFARFFKQPLVLLVFLLALTVPLNLTNYQHTAQAANINQQIPENIEFKKLIDSSYAAWNIHDPKALSKFYAKDADLIFYDALPLQYTGWENYETGIQKHLFDNMTKFHLTANDDVRTTRKGDIAWTTFTWHLSAKLNNGTPIETDGRQTDIWEKRAGNWLIVHEHISSPVNL